MHTKSARKRADFKLQRIIPIRRQSPTFIRNIPVGACDFMKRNVGTGHRPFRGSGRNSLYWYGAMVRISGIRLTLQINRRFCCGLVNARSLHWCSHKT